MTLPDQPLHADLRTLLGLRHTPDMRLRAIVRGYITSNINVLRLRKKVEQAVEHGWFPMRLNRSGFALASDRRSGIEGR